MATSNGLAGVSRRGPLRTGTERLKEAGLGGIMIPLVSTAILSALLGPVFGGLDAADSLTGTLLYVLAIHVSLYLYLTYFHLGTVKKRSHLASIHVPLVLLVALAGAFKLDSNLTYFLVPFAFGAILLTLLFRTDLAVGFSFAAAALMAPLYGFEAGPVILCMAAQLLGIFAVRGTRKRIHVMWACPALAGMNAILAVPYHFLGLSAASASLGTEIIYGAGSGILAAILAVGLLPILESVLDITTVFKIQELADLDHPLLRNLFLRAPGTYQHSMAVSNLAVTAAEAIGADWLLCRVGAYFHDIGKAERPEYFAENQGYGRRSRHENLKPSLSASVIKSHVTQGLKIAKDHRLPSAICDFIPQHHGTSVIRFFYGKALDTRQVGPESKGEFRHSGPKPQSKETAIVMLSDSVEAVSRTLEKPSPSTVEETVREIVRERMLDGDLDESNLTLRDLNTIAESFIKVLNGVFHARPEYPKVEEIQAAEKEVTSESRPRRNGSEKKKVKGKRKGRARKPRKTATG
ncbi:MAG: HDIG domain-containing protein [Planctomycetota bacterium]|nr:HDIG domain-containing protein [Planctomycetota bacterium]